MEHQFLRIIDNEIIIPGLKKSYTFIQISDTHLMATNEKSEPAHVQKVKEQELAWLKVKKDFADIFGEPCNEAHEISTIECFENIMSFIKEQNPDLLLLSGDVLNYEHEEGYGYFTEYMKCYPGEWLFVPGNHDNGTMPQKLGIDGIQVRELEGVRVIGLDDSKMTLSVIQLEQLKQQLADGKPTILVMHVPVETDYNKEEMDRLEGYFVINKDQTDANGREFIGVCQDEAAPIAAVLCGHIHGYQKSQLIPGRFQICCSSGMVGFVHRIVVKGETI